MFWSATINPPSKPLLSAPGQEAHDDFIGTDIGPDGSDWGAFYADCSSAPAHDPVCTGSPGFNPEVDRGVAGRLLWP